MPKSGSTISTASQEFITPQLQKGKEPLASRTKCGDREHDILTGVLVDGEPGAVHLELVDLKLLVQFPRMIHQYLQVSREVGMSTEQ